MVGKVALPGYASLAVTNLSCRSARLSRRVIRSISQPPDWLMHRAQKDPSLVGEGSEHLLNLVGPDGPTPDGFFKDCPQGRPSVDSGLGVTVTVTDVDETPVITGDAAPNYAENADGPGGHLLGDGP